MKLVVVGLGYVGLPLAIALARHFEVWGIDIDAGRIAELKDGHDRTGEIDSATLRSSTLNLTSDPAQCPAATAYIVTVPTPIDADKRPDASLWRPQVPTLEGLAATAAWYRAHSLL